jgi:hypothetical protein
MTGAELKHLRHVFFENAERMRKSHLFADNPILGQRRVSVVIDFSTKNCRTTAEASNQLEPFLHANDRRRVPHSASGRRNFALVECRGDLPG